MGGKTVSRSDTKIASIQIQTSSYGLAKPVIYGTNRVSANLLWFGNFSPIAHTTKTSSGGKGLGKVTSKDTTYTYTAAAIMGLAEGPIAGIGSVWKDKDKTTLAALGLTLFTGTATQSVWSFLTSYNVSGNWSLEQAYGYNGQSASFTNQAINYSSTAYVAASAYDLGSDAAVPNHGFEVQGISIYGSGIVDANPAVFIPDMLTSQQYGVGLASAQVDPLTSYSNYIRATGMFLSPAYTEQQPAADLIKEICDLTNAAPVWSGGLLKILPYGDATLTGNGATYTPALTPLFDLDDDSFQGSGDDPIRITRTTPADAFNRFTLEFCNRTNQYNLEIVSTEDQDAIEKFGLKPAPMIQAHMICTSVIAKYAVELIKQRSLYKRNEYEFGLDARYPMLEPMDIVTLTETVSGMSKLPVRITVVEEQDDGFRITAEDLPIGIAAAAQYTHDNGLRWQQIVNTSPLDAAAPIIFEMPARGTTTGLALAIAAGGQTTDPLYGGCRVWLSLDGNNYQSEGIIYGSSRYGTTTASLPAAAAGNDAVNTLSLSLRSNSQLTSGSVADKDKGTTLLRVGNEFLSYQTATLTGTNAYNLTVLNRGLYSTDSTSAAKASGSSWVRIDDAIVVLKNVDPSMVGQTFYIKLTAFNTYATGEQDLSAVSAYTYTILGDMKALETPIDFASVAVPLTAVSVYNNPLPYILGNTIRHSAGGSNFNQWGITKQSITGAMGVSAAITSGTAADVAVVGLTTDSDAALAAQASGLSYQIVDYAIYCAGAPGYYYLENIGGGTLPALPGAPTPSTSDVLAVISDDVNVRYYVNGVVYRTVPVSSPGLKMRGIVILAPPNEGVSGFSFGPNSSNQFGSIGGAGKPDPYATAGDNLIANASLLTDASQFLFNNAPTRVAGVSGDPSPGLFNFQILAGESDFYANNSTKVSIQGATKLYWSVYTKRLTGNTAGVLGIGLDFFNAAGTYLSPSTYLNAITPGSTGAWVAYSGITIPPTNAAYALIYLYCTGCAGAAMQMAAPRVGTTQLAADVTGSNTPTMTSNPSVVFTGDYLGTVDAGQLTYVLPFSRLLGGVNVDDTTTYSFTKPATVTATIDTTSSDNNRGNVSITALSGSGYLGDIIVTSVRDGITIITKTAVNFNLSAAPVGGGAGATTATINSWATSASSTNSVIGGPVTVRAPASGNISISGSPATKTDKATSPDGLYGCSCTVEWYNGSSWVAVGAEISNTSEAEIITEPPKYQNMGSMTISRTKTSLTSGIDYQFRISMRHTGSHVGTSTRTFNGNVYVNQA